MRTWLTSCTFALFTAIAAVPAFADDDFNRREAVQKFGTLPDGVRFPEGITANPANGDIVVGTLDFGPNRNKLVRFDRHGKVQAVRDFGSTPLLGLAFRSGKVYIANLGAGKVQRIAANFNAGTPIEDVAALPSIGAPLARLEGNPDGSSDSIVFGSNGAAAPNGLAFDSAGNLWVSDSFQGALFRINNAATCAPSCTATPISHDPLLATAGFPPFGANGLAFNADETLLFVANTGDDRVLKFSMASHALTVFAEGINGADGLVMDKQGRLWVAANQNDEIVALDANGRPTLRVGEFEGIRRDGTPDGLLFPASMVILGDEMFVTNLALPLTSAVGDEPEEDVTRWNVVRIKLPKHH
ncbi:MAG TPA: SMP-30/gluconolactonase/LRE family protein [Burkholderiales bacterium]|nr:SMP-30/gluconolactonase/LRE family protein [Burkholderiales bacterium]